MLSSTYDAVMHLVILSYASEQTRQICRYHQKGEATRGCQAVACSRRAVTWRSQGSYLPTPVVYLDVQPSSAHPTGAITCA